MFSEQGLMPRIASIPDSDEWLRRLLKDVFASGTAETARVFFDAACEELGITSDDLDIEETMQSLFTHTRQDRNRIIDWLHSRFGDDEWVVWLKCHPRRIAQRETGGRGSANAGA
jgi:hypothetical protein